MIRVNAFFDELTQYGIDFYTGVPDSLLKDICAYITDNTCDKKHIIAANEGAAIALGAGYSIATNKIPLIYMQNSGLGNAINPLMSLADKEVYAIPMILLIGWRGEPGVKDEPQHIKQGRITPDLLETMEIPYTVLDVNSDYKEVVQNAVKKTISNSSPVAILVRKGTFENYKLRKIKSNSYTLSREQALELVLDKIPSDSIIVSTTGMLSRELFEIRERKKHSHQTDFLTVGSMGHTSQIAMGIALAQPDKTVFCLDGDGSAIMHLGSYAVAGSVAPTNLKIIVFNNEAHDSVGGQPTIGNKISFADIGNTINLLSIGTAKTKEELNFLLEDLVNSDQTALFEIKIIKGARHDLGRPSSTPIENKNLLQKFINV